ncbi:MAG: ImmA/IrrE family metallo-endopeptidase [Burkholderiaceae bacterium]
MWRLGRSAIQDLALVVEGAGIILVREETGIAQIEGLSAWSEVLGRPLILLSADKDNGYRSRFDLAHEIAHVVLHRHIQRTTDSARHKLMEQQAHRFAGAFLLPAETFAPEVRVPPTLDDDGALMLFKRRSARWGAKSEPGDDDRRPEQPRLLRRTIDLLVEEKVMPLDAIPRHIGLAAGDIEALAGLPEGYFQGKTKVVEFVRLKAVQKPTDDRPGQGNEVVQFRPVSNPDVKGTVMSKNTKQTSSRIGRLASETLQSSSASQVAKSLAASALAQRAGAKPRPATWRSSERASRCLSGSSALRRVLDHPLHWRSGAPTPSPRRG